MMKVVSWFSLLFKEAMVEHWTASKTALTAVTFVFIFVGWIPEEFLGFSANETMNSARSFVALVVLLGYLFFGPLYYAYRREENRELEFEKSLNEAKAAIMLLERKLQSQIETHEAERNRLTALAELKLNEGKSLAVEVERWIDSGEKLMATIEKFVVVSVTNAPANPPIELTTLVNTWKTNVERFVKENAPTFLKQLLNARHLPSRPAFTDKRKTMGFTPLRDAVANRVDRLRELHAQLS